MSESQEWYQKMWHSCNLQERLSLILNIFYVDLNDFTARFSLKVSSHFNLVIVILDLKCDLKHTHIALYEL